MRELYSFVDLGDLEDLLVEAMWFSKGKSQFVTDLTYVLIKVTKGIKLIL